MEFPAVMDPLVDIVKMCLERFVQWNVDHEWIGSKSLLLVTPGEGLDAKAIELADTIGFDVATMKVIIYSIVSYMCTMYVIYASRISSYSVRASSWKALLLFSRIKCKRIYCTQRQEDIDQQRVNPGEA